MLLHDASVLFSTARMKAMDIAMGDIDDLCMHWKNFPPAPDFEKWDKARTMELFRDMVSDRFDEPRTCYRLIVRDKANEAFIGYINVWKLSYHHFLPTLGIALEEPYQNKGYGTEIYRGLIAFAFEKFVGETQLQAEINPENTPSIKLHFNCGMQPFCFVKDGYREGDIVEDETTMRISRQHFEKNGAYRAALSL